MIRQPNSASALISCPSNQERKITVPTSAILDLPVSCRLHTANFTISLVEYTHLADYKSALVNIGKIGLDIELEFFTCSPNKQLALNLSLTHRDIDKLRQQNADFGKPLKEQEKRHERLWSEVDSGRTGIEQKIIYSLIATAIRISGIAMCCVLKMQVMFWKRQLTSHGQRLTNKDSLLITTARPVVPPKFP